MIHAPCKAEDPNAPCMDSSTGRCRWRFPKDYQEETILCEDEPPKYRRRDVVFSNYHVYRKDKNGDRVIRDNRHVAPYNAFLLKRYNCHMNVEYIGGVKAVTYLYIYKGYDIAQVKVNKDERHIIYDECDCHTESRYVSSYKICWCLFEYELQRRSHKVQRLYAHLPGQLQRQQNNLPEVGQKGSTLEAWFKLNKAHHLRRMRSPHRRQICQLSRSMLAPL
uniref:Uncharacterized protein n=1 Tax=Acrobeloides nanus TaxID=290746 RepID=A0A914D035_9BILA